MATGVHNIIDDFLAQKRIAFVGVSRNPRSFSRKLFHEFRSRGYDVVPVNLAASDIDGLACYLRTQDIQPPVDAVLLMTSREASYRALIDCQEAGVRRVWTYGVRGPRQASAGAVEFCAAHQIALVPGYCPFMFLPNSGFFHRFHGRIMKVMGSYPS